MEYDFDSVVIYFDVIILVYRFFCVVDVDFLFCCEILNICLLYWKYIVYNLFVL